MEKEIGKVFSYYSKAGVAAIKLTDNLKKGDKIRIIGHTTNFEQAVDSIEIKNKKIDKAKSGDDIGIKVSEKVRPNDKVFLIQE